jgi:ParB family chromosome partitioning protein
MRQALGKGLDALFKQAQTGAVPGGDSVKKIPISKIKPNRSQPRKNFSDESLSELAQSIKKHGLAQPVSVVYDASSDDYELVAGERRLRASKLAGFEEIDAVVRARASDEDMLALALVENIQREDLNPVDTAQAFRELMDKFGVAQTELAQYCGKSRSAVSNCLRLLELETEILKALQSGALTEGHARTLLMVPVKPARLRLFREIIASKMTVRQAEDAARLAANGGDSPARTARRTASKTADVAAAEERLRNALCARVEIRPSARSKGGSVIIRYNSLDEFDNIFSRLADGVRQ